MLTNSAIAENVNIKIMSIIIKTKEEIEILREGGKRLATVLYKIKEIVKPGISTKDLDNYAFKLIREMGDEPAFLNYKPEGADFAYPASLCVSVNNEVVHGIPNAKKILQEGDIVSLDLGLKHKELYTDMALTVPVGDISHAIESFVRSYRYGIVEVLSGHGVGKYIHEDPYVPNFGKANTGAKLIPGMVMAIEPMLNNGTKNVILDKDRYTFHTADGKKSAHFEHTILITESEPEILTRI